MGSGRGAFDIRSDLWEAMLQLVGEPVCHPVREPATMLLLASGLVGLAGFRGKFLTN